MIKKGEKIYESAAKRKLEEFLKTAAIGRTYTFDELSAVAGEDVKVKRYLVHSVDRVLRRHHNRTLVSIRGEGYQICPPEELHLVSRDLRQSGKRKFSKGMEVLNTVSLLDLNDKVRRDHLIEMSKSGAVLAVCRLMDSPKTTKALKNADIEKIPIGAKALDLLKKSV